MPRKRTTIYAAFSGSGVPVQNAWDFSKPKLEMLVSDRIANGEAFPGEHVVRVTIEFYNRKLTECGITSRVEG